MVKETKILFDLNDLTAIRVQCGHCPNEVVLRPGAKCIPMPERCVNCDHSWIQGNKNFDLTRQLVYLLSYIQSEVTDSLVHLRFELRDD